jgi:FkbM family methyltransferase
MNVKTYNIGLSNYKGECVLNTSKSHNGLHTLGSKPLRFTDIVPMKINVDTLDNLFYENDIHVDFIKIDTEGWEYFILQGGEKTIQKYKPFIQMECSKTNMKQCNVDVSEFERYIIDTMGYKKKKMVSEELFLIPK